MQTTSANSIVLALGLLLLPIGCGDDAPSDPREVNPEPDAGASSADMAKQPIIIERDRTVGSLSSDEAYALCCEFELSFNEILPRAERLRFNCTLAGIFTGAYDMSVDTDEKLQEACVPLRDMCIEEGLQVNDFLCMVAAGTQCEATVAQAQACHEAEARAYKEFFSTITCEEAQLRQTGGQGLGEIPLPPECETLYDLCPEFE